MAKDDTGGDSTFDDKLPSVLGTMMRGAQRDERVRIMLTAFGARNDMVKIEKRGVPATWHDATSAVASQNLASYRRRDLLVGTNAFADRVDPVLDASVLTHVGVANRDEADMLGIAARHLDDVRADFDLLAPSLLPAAMAIATDGHRNLVACATLVGGSPERLTRHEQKCRVFIERAI